MIANRPMQVAKKVVHMAQDEDEARFNFLHADNLVQFYSDHKENLEFSFLFSTLHLVVENENFQNLFFGMISAPTKNTDKTSDWPIRMHNLMYHVLQDSAIVSGER